MTLKLKKACGVDPATMQDKKKAEPQLEVVREEVRLPDSIRVGGIDARPQPIFVTRSEVRGKLQKEEFELPSYDDLVRDLEPQILAQMAEVQAVMESQGIGPDAIQRVAAWDITGDEVQVCLACKRVGHNYRPVTIRQDNAEIHMMEESLVIDLELSSRLGIANGQIAYDDEGVLTLRDLVPPGPREERARILERFRSFQKRHQNRDVKDGSWMGAELKHWKPADATRKVRGEPDDRGCFSVSQAMFARANLGTGVRVRGVTIIKSQMPAQSLRGLVATMTAKGLKISSIAVGQNASAVAAALGAKTAAIAPTLHHLRDMLGKGMALLIRQA